MPTQGTWLECNGQSTTGFPELTAIIGTNVPDYRGVFLRGLGSQTSTHYGTILHSSGMLGALQGDGIRNITGSFGRIGAYYGEYDTGPFTSDFAPLNDRTGVEGSRTKIAKFDASLVVPISNENRPINRAVRYLIKAA